MKIWKNADGNLPTAGCCTLSDSEDARRVADQLNIPYYVWDYTHEFSDTVVQPFIQSYQQGQTPNPCIECNRHIKFEQLLKHAHQTGYQHIATGHYARTRIDGNGKTRLYRAADPTKDQSYVLSVLNEKQLRHTLFPIGELTKKQTREHAKKLGLRTHNKPDSQDICFVGNRNYKQFLTEQGVTTPPGQIVDHDGTPVGTHQGIQNFTVGQRKNLGLNIGQTRYVTHINTNTGTVTVGTRPDLEINELTLTRISWVNQPAEGHVLIQWGPRMKPIPAEIRNQGTHVRLRTPTTATAPGQTVAFYQPDGEVLGSGILQQTSNKQVT